MGPPLIFVGVLMMRFAVEIQWDEMRQALPAFVTMILMPLTYSIAYGLIGGIRYLHCFASLGLGRGPFG